jgi:predicted acetyltransferase
MTVSLRDARAVPADREWIAQQYRDYLDDLAALNTGLFPALDEFGHREPDQLERWFGDPSAALLTLLDDMRPVGFAMVTRRPRDARDVDFRMSEFFVARAVRGRGIGRSAVRLILDRFAGRWEIVEYMRNPGAVAFWRRVIGAYTRGAYRERVSNGEVRQHFTSQPSSPR